MTTFTDALQLHIQAEVNSAVAGILSQLDRLEEQNSIPKVATMVGAFLLKEAQDNPKFDKVEMEMQFAGIRQRLDRAEQMLERVVTHLRDES